MKRLYEHKTKVFDGFTTRYGCWKLVYYEIADDIVAAIRREKQIKGGSRAKKLALIHSLNLAWIDLDAEVLS